MSNITAFILGAGFGTRLRPLTLDRPKPLLPLLGRPIIDYALFVLRQSGHKNILINAHHLWQQVAQWAEQNDVALQVELPSILGTGGGLKAAEAQLAEKVLIWNGDIISDIDIKRLYEDCSTDGARMGLRKKSNLGKTTRLQVDEKGIITRIGTLTSTATAPPLSTQPGGLHFTGIHTFSRHALQYVPKSDEVTCIVRSAYCELVPQEKVTSFVHQGCWVDAGTPIEYFNANMQALRGEIPLPFNAWESTTTDNNNCWISNQATVEGDIQSTIVGAHASIPSTAQLSECIVWDRVTVPPGSYQRCIFHDSGILQLS